MDVDMDPPQVANLPVVIPDRYSPAVDDLTTGHIRSAGQQMRAIQFGPILQDVGITRGESFFQIFVQSFKDQGLLRQDARGPFSFLYCPLIWRILARTHPDVPAHWLTYGDPPGFDDLDRQNFAPGVDPRALYSPGALIVWDDIVARMIGIAGLSAHVEQTITAVDQPAEVRRAPEPQPVDQRRAFGLAGIPPAPRRAPIPRPAVPQWEGPVLPLTHFPLPAGIPADNMYRGLSMQDLNELIGRLSHPERAEYNVYLGMRQDDRRPGRTVDDMSFCPICLAVTFRPGGCMYLSHQCQESERHPALYERYRNRSANPIVGWCTFCGRVSHSTDRHVHTGRNDIIQRVSQKSESRNLGYFDPDDGRDCSAVSGGRNEKYRRYQRFIYSLCMAIPHIGRVNEWIVQMSRIEYIWMADTEPQIGSDVYSIPCVLPDPVQQVIANRPVAEVAPPADLIMPERFASDDAHACVVSAYDEEGDPVFQLRHNQAHRNVHNGTYICAKDLYGSLMRGEQGVTGKCPLGNGCTEWIWPEEIANIGLTAEEVTAYRTSFNALRQRQAVAQAGGRSGIIRYANPDEIENLCPIPRKKKGSSRPTRRNYRVYRKKCTTLRDYI